MRKNLKIEKHHYVPRCYLKNFTFDEKESLVYAYQRTERHLVYNRKKRNYLLKKEVE